VKSFPADQYEKERRKYVEAVVGGAKAEESQHD